MRNLHENVLFSTVILGLVFSDHVVFYGVKLVLLLPKSNQVL